MSDPGAIDRTRLAHSILDTLGVPAREPWYIAYSGGLDSTVLLHLLSRIARDNGVRLVALHADHGLNERSTEWRRICERRCDEWGVECRAARLSYDSMTARGAGVEGRARDARYRWFAEITGGSGWVFTAHHRGDQAETVIERLSRGAGPRGLRGMQAVSRLYGVQVARPLLNLSRVAIRDYARRFDLDWITDESNEDTYFTRNYIRNRVLPMLRERWPDIEAALARTASTMADAQSILDGAAAEDIGRVDPLVVRGDPSLSVRALRALEPARRRNVLRQWVHTESGVALSYRRLHRLDRAVDGRDPAAGGLRWPPLDLRVHRGRLYLLQEAGKPAPVTHWNMDGPLNTGGGIVLNARRKIGEGLRKGMVAGGVSIAFRRGGEKCRLPGRRHHHALKQLFQEAGVPPWQRDRVPLVTVDGEIAAVVGLTVCEPFMATDGEEGVVIEARYD